MTKARQSALTSNSLHLPVLRLLDHVKPSAKCQLAAMKYHMHAGSLEQAKAHQQYVQECAGILQQ